jgi:hypothetical protein
LAKRFQRIFKKIDQSETRIACGAMFVNIYWSGTQFSSPCQRQCELLPSLGVRRSLTFHILIFSSETAKPIDLKLDKPPTTYVSCYLSMNLYYVLINEYNKNSLKISKG